MKLNEYLVIFERGAQFTIVSETAINARKYAIECYKETHGEPIAILFQQEYKHALQ